MNMGPKGHGFRAAFTLIEILIVIAIVAILSVTVIVTINPVEILKRSRDSTRSSDLGIINKALSIYETDQPSGDFGSAAVVYVSVPDSSGTCANLGLPTLPSGYTYSCSTSANIRNVDGTGWIPVDFTEISSGAPFSSLPIDPVNSTSTGLYYAYVPGGSWELNATVESLSYKLGGDKDSVSSDGGNNPSQMEVGTDLALSPIEYGDASLMNYWSFDIASTSVLDVSGKGNNATKSFSPVSVTGKVGTGMTFSGSNYISIASNSTIDFGASQNFTVMTWIKSTQAAAGGYWPVILAKEDGNGTRTGYLLSLHNSNVTPNWFFQTYSAGSTWAAFGTSNIADGNWHHIAGVKDGSNIHAYQDGVLAQTAPASSGSVSKNIPLVMGTNSSGKSYSWYAGSVDETRIYNRALSAQEIYNIYESAK